MDPTLLAHLRAARDCPQQSPTSFMPTEIKGQMDNLHWRPVPLNAPITSWMQYYAEWGSKPGWRLTSFVTADDETNSHAQNMREPSGVYAYLSVAHLVLHKHLALRWFRLKRGMRSLWA